MASTNFSGRHAGIGVLVAVALAGCLRHETPVTGSIKDDTPHVAKPSAKDSKPAPVKKPVKKTAAAAAKTEAATSKAATPSPAAPVAAKAAPAPVTPPVAPKAAAAPAAPATTVPPKAAIAPVLAPPAPKAAIAAPTPPASAAPAATPPPKAAAVQPPAAPAPAPKAAAPAPAPTDARGRAVQQISEARRLFDTGKVIEARKRIMASIDAAPADANHALAQTYDPHYVSKVTAADAGADLGRALQIYTTAVQTGSKDAEPDLARLRVSLGLAPK